MQLALDYTAAPTAPVVAKTATTAPYQRNSDTSKAAAKRLDADKPRKDTLQTYTRTAYWNAGPRGMTCEEAAEKVTQLRGKHTKETTINGRVCGENPELDQWIVNSGRQRANRGGDMADIFVHRRWLDNTAPDAAH